MKITALEGHAARDATRALPVAATLAVLVALAVTSLAPTSSAPPDAAAERMFCLTPADVRRHAERSREGISLVCNEEIRQRNLQRERRP